MSWITGLHRRTRTKDLLKEVNWLSINQLIYYHGFLTIYKVRKNSVPRHNFRHLNAGLTRRGRIALTKRRWSGNIQALYNSLSPAIRNESKISLFKKNIKTWIKCNIGVFKCDDWSIYAALAAFCKYFLQHHIVNSAYFYVLILTICRSISLITSAFV